MGSQDYGFFGVKEIMMQQSKWETWMKQMGAVESIELKGEPEKVVSQYSSSLHFFFLTIAFAFRFRNDYYG